MAIVAEFRRVLPEYVDLTSATSDVMLEVGQIGVIRFTNTREIALHVAVPPDGAVYEIVVHTKSPGITQNVGAAGPSGLKPNNLTYGSTAFGHTQYYRNSSSLGSGVSDHAYQRVASALSTSVFLVSTSKTLKCMVSEGCSSWGNATDSPTFIRCAGIWKDSTTEWTSLGTWFFDASCGTPSGVILVRRVR